MANELYTIEGESKTPQDQRPVGLAKDLWAFFGDMKTAIVLLLLLALVSILGTVIRQNALPGEYTALYGPRISSIITHLGLSNIFNSNLYKLILSLVGLNLTVCSINRFGMTWRRTFQPKPSLDAKSISKMQRTVMLGLSGSPDAVAKKMTTALRAGSYRVIESRESDGVSLYAAKGRLSIWGPYLTHLSLLVIFIGAIFGNVFGFTGNTTITEGKSTSVYASDRDQKDAKLGFSVMLHKFAIGYDKSHNPTSYESDLRIYEGKKLAAQKVIDVNHPMSYKGVSFYQSGYGLSGIVLKITAPNGETARVKFDLATQNETNGAQFAVSGEPLKTITISNKQLTVFVHDILPDYDRKLGRSRSSLPINPAVKILINDRFPSYKGLDAWTKLNWLERGKPVTYKGFTVAIEKLENYTNLQVSRNPGLPVIYLGFALIMLGVFLSFYVPYKVIRIRITANGQGASAVVGAGCKDDPSVFDKDFTRLGKATN